MSKTKHFDGSLALRQAFAVLVLPEATLTSLRLTETGTATTRWAAQQSVTAAPSLSGPRSASWPCFLVWFVLAGALWLGERRVRRPNRLASSTAVAL